MSAGGRRPAAILPRAGTIFVASGKPMDITNASLKTIIDHFQTNNSMVYTVPPRL
jgi:hypothetical protein